MRYQDEDDEEEEDDDEPILPPAFYNDIAPYLEKRRNNGEDVATLP